MAEWITTAITSCTSLFNGAIDMITGNALMAVLLVGGTLIPLGFRIFRSARRTAN
jgi:hypothetical protein